MSKLLISAETILPISSDPISNGTVAVKDGVILDVGDNKNIKKKYSGFKFIDLGKGFLLPGFINGHVHLELGWIKSEIGKFNNFIEWLQLIIKAKSNTFSKELITNSVKKGINSLIKSGVTTVGEISSYEGLDKTILKKSGLRTILFYELFDRHLNFVENFDFEHNGLFEERLFPHAPYSCSPELILKTIELSIANDTPFGLHLGESKDEVNFLMQKYNNFEKVIFPLIKKEKFKRHLAKSPFDYIKKFKGLKNTKLTAVHMVQVKPHEIKRIKELEIGVLLCPRSNLFLKVGFPPLKEITKLERIGLGTDGLSSNYNLNFFEEIRTLHSLLSEFLGSEASYLTVYAATLGGAKALFLENKIGSIEKNKEADLIFIKSDNKMLDPYLSVISSTDDDLTFSMVKGETIYSKADIP